jgi:UDP-N-acetylmuramoyl-tripeptide--D-alanyl-D-alanine ligase
MATPIPENRVELTLAEIARATGGEVRAGRETIVRGVTTDSRGDVRGKLFVALEGENFDGHAFVADAARGGADAVMVSRNVDVPTGVAVVRVGSTLPALGALARFQRHRWAGTLVAVAGSAGKTTTKTAIAAALEAVFPGAVHAAAGNLNNLVGVPMVLFGLGDAHRAAVVEIGTNRRGEVAELGAMVEPDIAVLTLIAVEHAAGIGDLDAIEAEEGSLFDRLGPAGTAIGNGDDARVRRQLEQCEAERLISYGTAPDVGYRVVERAPSALGRASLLLERPAGERPERVRVETSLVGLPGALAVAAAFAVADRVAGKRVDAASIERELAKVGSGEPGRLSPIPLGDGGLLLDDSYNSNPASVLSAVSAAQEIARVRDARLLLVLGEMRELGKLSESEHKDVGAAVGKSAACALVAVGGDARHLSEAAQGAGLDAVFAEDPASALLLVLDRVRPGDVVLVKASRGVRAERIVEGLIEAKGSAA